jgi:hypothetical protein
MNEITPLQPGPPVAADVSLRRALLDSRQRWRDLVMTAADIVFETDASGRFIFMARSIRFASPFLPGAGVPG